MIGLEQPACYLSNPEHVYGTFNFVTPSRCIEAKYNKDVENHNIKIFDAQYWKENSLDCIMSISPDRKK